MPVEIKNNLNRGMDIDTSYYILPKDSYIDALNITRDAIEGSNDGTPTNIVGNRLVSFNLPAGINKTIGAFPFQLRNVAYEFLYNSNGYNSIIEYNNTTRTRTLVFQSLTDSDTDILQFSSTGKITSVNIYPSDNGDLLFFLDTLGRPTTLNIDRFKANEYNPVTRDIIDVAKPPLPQPPDAVYANDTARRVNNLRNKFFKFVQVPVFDDDEEAVFSPQSAMPIPYKLLDDTYANEITNNNVINLSLNSGGKNVKAIRLLMSYVEKSNIWSAWATVEVINKADESISDDTVFSYSFYNDSTYATYDPIRAFQLFDYVPTTAECQDMANGNTIEYAGLTEGLNRNITPNVVNTINTIAVGNGGSIGTLNATYTIGGFPFLTILKVTFSGIPATGTVVTIKLKRLSDNVVLTVATYTTISGDNSATVATGLVPSGISIGIFSSSLNPFSSQFWGIYNGVEYEFNSITIVPPALGASSNTIPTWLWSSERNIAIAYFDDKGKTNGILYNAKITFPAYAENGSHIPLVPYINTKIYHVPPDWAYTYNFYFTKDPTVFLFWHIIDVNTTETDNLYFDISNLNLNALKNTTTASVLNYSFQDGDRMRLIRRMSDNTVYDDTYDTPILGYVTDPKISGIPTIGNFIKIKNIAPFNTVTYTTKNFVIQIYRPGQQASSDTNQTFIELGEEYPILNPTLSTRVHGGQVTNQSEDLITPAEFNFYDGDTYFRARTVPTSEIGIATFNVQDRNVVDFYTSAVSSISGRENVIDIYAKEKTLPVTVRFSQDIETDSTINRLNRFLPDNFIDAEASYGTIERIVVNNRQLETFQKLKIGYFPIFSKIGVDAGGNNVLLTTNELLNPIRYYDGDFGIGTSKASLYKRNYAIWGADNIKGIIWRLSKDGLTNISETFNFNSWSNEQIPLRITDDIIGGFDQKTNNYIFSLGAVTGSEATTRTFNQKFKSLESRLSYIPEMMCTLGTLLISYKNGQAYTHDGTIYNNFYGVQYPSSITLVWNENTAIKKNYLAVGYQSKDNIVWASPENGDILTNTINSQTILQQISQLKEADYILQESVINAAFLRDVNSLSDARLALVNGDYLQGNYMIQKFVCPANNATELISFILPYIKFIPSPRNL